MSDKRKIIKSKLFTDVPLSDFTSWHIGGNAEKLYWPLDVNDLANFLKQCPETEQITWLGLGSNVLIDDDGMAGTVIITQGVLSELRVMDNNKIYAQAGLSCPQVARFAAKQGLTGSEFLAGIPGTIGGALYMNAGAFGSETWERVSSVEVINHRGEISKIPASNFDYSYRKIHGLADKTWFIAAEFELMPDTKQQGLRLIKELLAKRSITQPTGVPTCGSVFKNPDGDYAARLIESLGLKGFSIGGASVSEKHANFIVNNGQATAQEVKQLIDTVQTKVSDHYNIELQPEVMVYSQCHSRSFNTWNPHEGGDHNSACHSRESGKGGEPEKNSLTNKFGKIAVIYGGDSAERHISLKTGNSILTGLQQLNLNATAIDFIPGKTDINKLKAFDRIFIALHGKGGEDGKLQKLLEAINIPYTGSSAKACSVAMNKLESKITWQKAGLPVPKFSLLDNKNQLTTKLNLPIAIKPITEGSSFGISKVTNMADLDHACQLARQYGDIIAEEWIIGTEYTVSIVDHTSLPSILIKTPREFYDYDAKYVEKTTEYICPSGLSTEDEQKLQKLALQAYNAIGCTGWGRVDFMRDTNGKFYLIEINTVPGMTSASLVPKAAKHFGWDFNELLLKILEQT